MSLLAGPVDLTVTPTDDEPDPGSCGNAEIAPLTSFVWTAEASGQYRITVTGASPHVVDVRGGACTGAELACRPASTSATIERALPANDQLTIAVSGAGAFELSIVQLPDVCGDNLCEASESTASCPSDCPATTCGDGVCEAGETASSCPADCATSSTCGNGICEVGEDTTCAIDCPTTSGSCGDGVCDAGEDVSCPSDCPTDTCGDGICSIGEVGSCSTDCDDGGAGSGSGGDDGSGTASGSDGGDDGSGTASGSDGGDDGSDDGSLNDPGGDDGGMGSGDDGGDDGSDDGGGDCDDCFIRRAHHGVVAPRPTTSR